MCTPPSADAQRPAKRHQKSDRTSGGRYEPERRLQVTFFMRSAKVPNFASRATPARYW
jgi:hypothetical protein